MAELPVAATLRLLLVSQQWNVLPSALLEPSCIQLQHHSPHTQANRLAVMLAMMQPGGASSHPQHRAAKDAGEPASPRLQLSSTAVIA
jgi:hypothetical protein